MILSWIQPRAAARVIRYFTPIWVLLGASPALVPAPNPEDDLVLRQPAWREIGPAAFGGRIVDVEAMASDPWVIVVGSASGGIFKSTNNGTTWRPVFDGAGAMMSIGDLAIAPSDPAVLWAGTGEPNNRQSSSWGRGVFRSLDGGERWESAGLEETHHIGRVVIHPGNPEIVFVAALGRLWGASSERGVYRTRNAGATWEKVLFIDNDTGVVDLAMEQNGRVLYAAAYQRRRRAWGFVGGGPGSGIYRSLDGGDHWTRLRDGLPAGTTGRIGLSIARHKPETVYAIVEHRDGGVFRSDDRGTRWARLNTLNPRPSYYSQIRVDPTNTDRVWVLGSVLYRSDDGGKTFTSKGTAERVHVDHHALWIDPANPTHMILGNDGGLWQTYDGARTWDFRDNLPIAQYYSIGLDDRDPYRIYGGTQDNGSWVMPSRTYSRLGITNADVTNLAYGDGFFTEVDPGDPGFVYAESQNGRIYRISLATLEEQGIRPAPSNPDEKYRFNWKSPIHISPHDSKVVYCAANKLFRSLDRGHSWEEISPDLTLNQEWQQLPVMNLPRDERTLSRNDGIAHYGTITAISESSFSPGVFLVGTDDGQIQVSRDGGRSWLNRTGQLGLVEPLWVSSTLHSLHEPGAAYVTLDGHRDNDFSPYLFRTSDQGETWSSVASDLPDGTVLNVIAEHPDSGDVLLAGSESGLFVTLDRGLHWLRAGGGLPPVPVDDIAIHSREKDIVLGTHGRGIWILDDASFLAGLNRARAGASLFVFPTRRTVQGYQKRMLPRPGAGTFRAPNPPEGALITYYVPARQGLEEMKSDLVEVLIRNDSGQLVRSLTGPATPGVQRISWDLRRAPSFESDSDRATWYGQVQGPYVIPGTFRVEVKGESLVAATSLVVVPDPLAQTSPEALRERLQLSLEVDRLLALFFEAAELVSHLEVEIHRISPSQPDNPHDDPGPEALSRLRGRVDSVSRYFAKGRKSERARFLDLYGQLQASTRSPTVSQRRTTALLKKQLRKHIEELNTLVVDEWPRLMHQIQDGKTSRLKPVEWP